MFYRVRFTCNFVGCEEVEIIEAENENEAREIASEMMMDIICPDFGIEASGETEEDVE